MADPIRFSLPELTRRQVLRAALACGVGGGWTLTPFRRVQWATRARQGLALCIGLNEVDPRAYRGWRGTLRGCIPDSKGMEQIALQQGFYDVKRLNNEQATINHVRQLIAWAANDLRPGDLFMISISSHGAYRTDTNQDEVDGRDETWCLWDGQWVDDARYEMWQRFARGVRILVIGDLCHSGTTARALQALDGLAVAERLDGGERGLDTPPPAPQPAATAELRVEPQNIAADLDREIRAHLKAYADKLDGSERDLPDPRDPAYGEQFNFEFPDPIRAMPNALAEFLSAVETERSLVPGEPRLGEKMRASGLSLSACQDHQTALDGPRNGVFTAALQRAWNGGAFQGSYETLFQTLQHLLSNYPTQQPSRDIFGAADGQFHREAAFQVA